MTEVEIIFILVDGFVRKTLVTVGFSFRSFRQDRCLAVVLESKQCKPGQGGRSGYGEAEREQKDIAGNTGGPS
jgi:hypothetical protein